jgi:hypothetical protein
LESLVRRMASIMVTQVKPTTPMLGDYLAWGFDPTFFYRVGLLGPLGLDEIELGILNDHVLRVAEDKTLDRVLAATPIIRASAQVREPRGASEILDPQWGEAQCWICLPQSFMLTNIVRTSMDTYNPMKGLVTTTRLSSSTSRI